MVGRRFEIFSKTWKKTLLLVLLTVSSSVLSITVLNPVAEVHAQGGFDYILSNSGGVTLVPGGSGSTTVIATVTSGTASNVTLSCDLTNLPPQNFTGTTCAFTPASVIPYFRGNVTRLTMTVPTTAYYGTFNVTVTGKNPAPIAPTIFVLTVAAKVAVDPTEKASRSYTVGTPITVELNVTYSPSFAGFIIGIFYNTSVLRFQGMDYSGGVLGDDAIVSSECVDGQTSPQCASPDLRFDAVGVASLSLFTSSGQNAITSTGKLFSVTFTVVGNGSSTIHFVHQELLPPCAPPCPTFNVEQSVGYDGFFTNEECGSGNLCKPPVVSFIPPLRPIQYRPASFNATALSQNPAGWIREYSWTWGSGADVHHYDSRVLKVGNSTKPETNATFLFSQIGEHAVTVSAQDNYGVRAYYTLAIDVFRVWVDLGFVPLSIDHAAGVIPGTVVRIVATAINLGVNPENSTVRLSINNENVATQPVQNLAPDNETSLRYDWNTAGYAPRVYQVEAYLDSVKNSTTGQFLENDTAINSRGQIIDLNNVKIAFVQLIMPLPGGFGLFLGLNLPETLGLGTVLVAVVVFAIGLVKKSRARGPEPL